MYLLVWLRLQCVAHQRIHGTTHEKPAQRLIEEVKHLLPLPLIKEDKPSQSAPVVMHRVPPMALNKLQHPMATYEALLQGDNHAVV